MEFLENFSLKKRQAWGKGLALDLLNFRSVTLHVTGLLLASIIQLGWGPGKVKIAPIPNFAIFQSGWTTAPGGSTPLGNFYTAYHTYLHGAPIPVYKTTFQRICANLKRGLNISGGGADPPILCGAPVATPLEGQQQRQQGQ